MGGMRGYIKTFPTVLHAFAHDRCKTQLPKVSPVPNTPALRWNAITFLSRSPRVSSREQTRKKWRRFEIFVVDDASTKVGC